MARLGGVSKTTASDALRGDRKVAASTRAKVQMAAAQLQYQPSAAISAVASKHFRKDNSYYKVLVLIFENPETRAPYYGPLRLLLGRNAGDHLGIHYDFYQVKDLGQIERRLEKAYVEGYEGLVLGSCPYSLRDYLNLENCFRHFSVVTLGGLTSDFDLPFHTIHGHYHNDVMLAFAKARQAKCRKIGFALFLHARELSDDRVRRSAALDCLYHLPKEERVPLLEQHENDPLNEENLAHWFKRHRPDCVISFLTTNYQFLCKSFPEFSTCCRFISLRIDEQYPEYGIIAGLHRNIEAHRWALNSTLREMMSLREKGLPEYRSGENHTYCWRTRP